MDEVHRSMSLERVQRTYAHWGRHPAAYAAQDWITFLGRHQRIRREAARALAVGPGASVLEVACGTGRNFAHIESVVGPMGSLVGFDYSPDMLSAARDLIRRSGWLNIVLQQGDAAILDAVGQFDAVLCTLGMSAIPDHIATLRRCRELLKPGGTMSVCDARLFPGNLRRLNALVRFIYEPIAAWNPERDIARDMNDTFGNVSARWFNFGSIFIATSFKR